MVTAPEGTVINGGTFEIPKALASKTFHPMGISCSMMLEPKMASSKAGLNIMVRRFMSTPDPDCLLRITTASRIR